MMRDVRSRHEYERQEQDLSRETDEKLEDEKVEAQQLEEIKQAFADLDDSALTETRNGLNQVVENTKTRGLERIDDAKQKVDNGAETEQQEVSDPAEENSSTAKYDAGGLEVVSRTIDRYETEIIDAMREKDEESNFFDELANRSKEHQETDTKEAEQTAQDAKNAMNSLRSF